MCCVSYGVSGLADCAVLRRCAMSAPAMRHKAAAMRPGPSEIGFKNMRFLITDRPTDATVPAFLEEFKKRNVKDVVRVCEATYQKDLLEKEGINVWDWQFDDGSPPPARVVEEWFQLLRTRFKEDPDCCIAVHCVAGLGRAPVLVALALIELGMTYEDAVELIRQKRRGAINAKQLSYLEKYRPKSRLRLRNGHRQCTVQ
ncbi:protein-tyrosine phosphatase 4A family member PRL-1 [Amblyomma americanum]|uniref:Protein tyrosine phosphatase iva1 n=5 Tax=Amblyomma TaxID=6942 RepID=A0A0C9S1H1_AMBAM